MTHFRFLPLATALFAASTLIACNTAPGMPMGSASAQGMAMPDQTAKMDMSKMDAQMKKMREMHQKMVAAKTPEERSQLMAEHMKTMQDSMQMMGSMSGMHGGGMGAMGGASAGDAKPMPGMPGMATKPATPGMAGMAGNMPAHHQMMEKRMAMMESMMQMMMDRMPAQPAR